MNHKGAKQRTGHGLGHGVVALALAVLLAGCGGRDPSAAAPIEADIEIGEAGVSPGQFAYPRAMDGDERSLWIIDKAARVQRVDARTGQYLGGWRMPEFAQGKPTGITVWRPEGGADSDELVFVPDTHYHRVMIYRASAPDGTTKDDLLCRFGEYGEGDGQFIYLTDVAVLPTPDGRGVARLYVSEYGGNDRVSIFEPDGGGSYRFVTSFGEFGSGPGVEFNRPQSIGIDGARQELIVADSCNHRIGRFSLEGELIAWYGNPEGGIKPGEFNYPYGFEILNDGTALIAEFGNNRVQHIDLTTGQGLGIFGEVGRGPGQLWNPWSVATVGGVAYVLDSGNNRVLGFKDRSLTLTATPRTEASR